MLQSSRKSHPLIHAVALAAMLALGCSSAPLSPGDSGPEADAGVVGGGGQSDGGARTDGGGLPLESACDVLNASRCEYLQRCGLIAEGDDALEDCEAYLRVTRCGPTRWPARVQAGTLQYHPANAAKCADAWLTQECRAFETEPRVCEDLTSPAASLGGRCYGGLRGECVEGVCTGGTCPRSCRARGDVGELCEETNDCKTWLYCRTSSPGSALGVCTAFGIDGAECDEHQPCAKGYVCGGFSRCEPAANVGEACTEGTCTEDAWCAVTTNGTGTCQPRAQEGDACTESAQCRPDLLCRPETGTCEPRTGVAEGEPCSREQTCAGGLECVGTAGDPLSDRPLGLGVCEAGRLIHAPCTSSWDCETPMACAMTEDGDGGVTGECGPRLKDGAACVETRDCSVLSACLAGQCVRLPQPGDSCGDGVCLYGACETADDAGLVCKGPGGPNAMCSENDDCASLRCVSGRCLAACTP